MNEPSDMERSRLLLGWLAARRAVDHCLSDLLAAGPAGERRVRESLAMVDDLETRAQVAFDRYRTAAETTKGHGTDPGSPAGDPRAGDGAAGREPAGNGTSGTSDDTADSRLREDAAVTAGSDPRLFEVDTRNVMPLRLDTQGIGPGGREAGNIDPRTSERWSAPRERPRLNIVRAAEADLARSSPNTKSNQRHR